MTRSRESARRPGPPQLPGGLRKQPLQERSKAAIRHVLDVAAELVTEHGTQAIAGSPTLLLERSGISRGSFYAFFETPERVLDELALQCILESRDEMRGLFAALDSHDWRAIVDTLVNQYWGQFRKPLVRELWVGENLSPNSRVLDRIWVDEIATMVLEQFERHAPQFESLSFTQCLVVVESMERLSQYAFRDDPNGDDDVMQEAHAMVMGYLGSFE